MKLNLQTFETVVANSAAAVQAGTNLLLDLSVGSVLRAILEANASLVLWLQWLIVCVLRMTRASTSTGVDLDTWMGDFNFVRLPPCSAVGIVTFSRYAVSISTSIPPGTLVKTGDGNQAFAVSVDNSNPAWNPVGNTYAVDANVASIEVPVVALVAGRAGNVQAGSITTIASPLLGIDTITNSDATYDGRDQEDDQAFRRRFLLFINSRSQATTLAVENAITSIQQNLSYSIDENQDESGFFRNGSFLITVDDGTGTPSPTLLAAVNLAVDNVRPVGSVFNVIGPVVQPVAISAHVEVLPGADRQAVIGAVTQCITEFVNSLPVGASFPITRVAQLGYDADPRVTNVTNLLANGAMADVTVIRRGVIKLSSLVVS